MTQQSQQASARQRTRSPRKRLRILLTAVIAALAFVAGSIFAVSILFKGDPDYVGSGKGEVSGLLVVINFRYVVHSGAHKSLAGIFS